MAKYRIVRVKGSTSRHRVEKRWFSWFGIELWHTVSGEPFNTSLEEAESWVHWAHRWERIKQEGREKTPRDTVVKTYYL